MNKWMDESINEPMNELMDEYFVSVCEQAKSFMLIKLKKQRTIQGRLNFGRGVECLSTHPPLILRELFLYLLTYVIMYRLFQ